MKAVAQQENVPCIDLITRYIAYEQGNNCLNVHGGGGPGLMPVNPPEVQPVWSVTGE
eukprot:COSAG02_NODE_51307_length_315_cov_0.472222_1_plen_56_part_10